MYGFEAISHYNGWTMAIAGALIVMSGLTILSFVISQLHRVAGLFEKRPEEPPPEDVPETPAKSFGFPLDDLQEAAAQCSLEAAALGEPFEIKALFEVLKNRGWPAPHLTIRTFRERGILVPAEDGLFSWKK
ncbi:MAG: OadG family protein [Deltaproteobacteria bacterium]|nr:OadG family protein [Deltaproteobacteria bacterium]MBW2040440.1 OadG family protein [Deltaproteobacteria bacterium]MBW2131865.1 OadG family protein [Deltaproteobacteria bacterium]